MSNGGWDEKPPRSNLTEYPTADLEAELQRRRDAERKAREVVVVCRWCRGRGGVDRAEGYSQCCWCDGTGRTIEVLVKDGVR